MAEDRDYYSVLGLNPDASEHEIEQTFRRFLHDYYCEGTPSLDEQQRLETVTEAYAVLIDPEQRAMYDERLGLTRLPHRRRHGFHLGLDVGIARVSVGIGQVDGPVIVGDANRRNGSRY